MIILCSLAASDKHYMVVLTAILYYCNLLVEVVEVGVGWWQQNAPWRIH